jgi:hypothetical protein
VWGYVVRDVDARRIGTDPEDDGLHGTGVVIARAEISQERYDWSSHDPVISYGVSAGFRKRNSRMFVFSRNDSETFSPLNIRMMSRF